ncbi:hypothetical protein LR48_Vigan06g110000 [Vigna angularis]|uniref:Uncharacterized protein n=1 Tax=Phaseolus angularis TaxID=3914 RepID=A0A0L9UTA9_PHAAN|nr:uncharacterized protein HKW66_Vig0174310 [Vigna angularis]KOM45794.1 hypothetical protein LR48_Vigan06g110000 [Vigna angularis]
MPQVVATARTSSPSFLAGASTDHHGASTKTAATFLLLRARVRSHHDRHLRVRLRITNISPPSHKVTVLFSTTINHASRRDTTLLTRKSSNTHQPPQPSSRLSSIDESLAQPSSSSPFSEPNRTFISDHHLAIFTNHAATTTNLPHLASFLAVAQPPWQPSHTTAPSRSTIEPA